MLVKPTVELSFLQIRYGGTDSWLDPVKPGSGAASLPPGCHPETATARNAAPAPSLFTPFQDLLSVAFITSTASLKLSPWLKLLFLQHATKILSIQMAVVRYFVCLFTVVAVTSSLRSICVHSRIHNRNGKMSCKHKNKFNSLINFNCRRAFIKVP